jgi:hypothetical protein
LPSEEAKRGRFAYTERSRLRQQNLGHGRRILLLFFAGWICLDKK